MWALLLGAVLMMALPMWNVLLWQLLSVYLQARAELSFGGTF